jgi:hypothetical protein
MMQPLLKTGDTRRKRGSGNLGNLGKREKGKGERFSQRFPNRLDSQDWDIIHSNSKPQINFVFVAAFLVVVGIGVLVGVTLLGVFVGFSFTNEEGKAYRSLLTIGDAMGRAGNATGQIVMALPAVNLTNITAQSIPQTDEEWVNLTQSLKGTGKKALRIVDRAEETDLLGKMAAFTETAVVTVTNPLFVRYVQQGVDHMYWVMGVLQSDDAVVFARALRKSIELYMDESPRGVVERNRLSRTLAESRDEVIGMVRDVREILQQINDQGTVEHATHLIKQARDNDIIGKAVHLYEDAEAAEEGFERSIRPFIRNLMDGLVGAGRRDGE